MTRQTPPETELPPPDPRLHGKVKIKKMQSAVALNSESPGHGNGCGNAAPTLVSHCAADIAPEEVEWLWTGRLARGKHTCIAGEPGTGKSQVCISIIAGSNYRRPLAMQ
jgi:predicted ATP-dependent serine protease